MTLKALDWTKDPIIHVNSSTAESQHICNAAIVGGYVGGNIWLLVISWADNAHRSWLTDEKWHRLADCPNKETK